jgi:uncharacterized repeat protein (TIGR03803 family)
LLEIRRKIRGTARYFNRATDGFSPLGGLLLAGGTLYGTARDGGSNGFGTVFSISTNGGSFNVLHTFSGTSPLSASTLDWTAKWGTRFARHRRIGSAFGSQAENENGRVDHPAVSNGF